MHVTFDVALTGTGLVVGLLVGLTGMGGGALLTPVLVLVFNVAPLAAVSTDLLTSLVMKPVGAAVHLRRGSVHTALVGYLVAVPSPVGSSAPPWWAGWVVHRVCSTTSQC